jgi:hypothetical protein
MEFRSMGKLTLVTAGLNILQCEREKKIIRRKKVFIECEVHSSVLLSSLVNVNEDMTDVVYG